MNRCCMPMMCCCGCQNGQTDNVPHIGENGNWFVGETDTGVKAQGPKGDPGEKGSSGTQGPVGPQGLPGSFANTELIFQGKANTKGPRYTLTKSIENYNCLIVTIGITLNDGREVEQYQLIPSPLVTQVDAYYSYIIDYSLYNGGLYRYGLNWHIPSTTTFCLDDISQGPPQNASYSFCIKKIYGLK